MRSDTVAGAPPRPRRTGRARRILGIGTVAALVAGALLTGAAAGHSSTGQSGAGSWLPPTPANWPTVVDEANTPAIPVTSGVTEHGETYDTVGGRQHAQVLDVDLSNPNVRIGAAEAGDTVIDPADETLTSMGDRTGAVAGINGDYFDINATGQPDGGVITGGRLVKSPAPNHAAQLGITASGQMVIGQQTYTGSVTDGTASHAIGSVNTTGTVTGGGITEVTPDLGAASGLTAATLVLGQIAAGGSLTVTAVENGVTAVAPLTQGTGGLLGAGAGGQWLAATVHVGDTLTMGQQISPNNNLTALVAGATMLVKDGQAYTDPTGQPPGGTNPETAVGLTKDGRHAFLVAIDGRLGESVATDVTPAQVTGYLLAHGAYTGLLFDGGGSTELAARAPGTGALRVMNTPSDGGERPVANGIFVYSTEKAPAPATAVVVNAGKPVTTVPGASIPVPVYATDARQNPAGGAVSVQVQPKSLASWSNGQLTVHGTGDGQIIARNGKATSSQPLHVVSKLASLAVSPDAPDLPNGHTQQLALQGTAGGFHLASGATAQVPAEAAHWSVSDPSLGSVDAHGLFTAADGGGGLVTVTATVAGASATASVAVGEVATTIDDTSSTATWTLRNTTGQPATLAAAPGDVPPGSTAPGSLALSYTMPAGAGVKQLVLSSSKKLTVSANADGVNPTQLGLWVKGDAKGLWFAESYIDIAGTTTTLYPTYITFDGWQLVTADIPPGLSFPLSISFVDFLALNPTTTYSGTVNVGGLEAMYSPRPVVAPAYTAIPGNPSWLSYQENAAGFSHDGDTLLVGDDAHLVAADSGSASSGVLDAAKARIPSLPAQARPDQVQMLGDMADDGAPADLAYAQQKIGAFGVPYHDAVGNHEISQGALPENGDFTSVFGDTHYAYAAGAAQVIVTDNAHGSLLSSDPYQVPAQAQYPWLVDQLTSTKSRAVIVVTHEPAYDPHPVANSQFGDRWEAQMYLRLIQRYQQTHPKQHVIMLYGHARGFAEQILDPQGDQVSTQAGGVPQFTVADLGMPAYATADKGGFEHFGLFHVTANGDIEFSVEGIFTAVSVSAPQPSLAAGGHETLSATGTQVAGDNFTPPPVPIADPVSHVWSTSDAKVATVDARTGVVTAHRPGTVTVTVTAGGVTGEQTVTVTK
jgi:exopolysaccharide biosynthesis protein/uncharacterized protein YjdB